MSRVPPPPFALTSFEGFCFRITKLCIFQRYVNIEPYIYDRYVHWNILWDTSQTSHLTSLNFRNLGSSNVGAGSPAQSLLLVGKPAAPFASFPDGEDSVSLSLLYWTEEGKWSHPMVSVYTALALAGLEVEVNAWSWFIQACLNWSRKVCFCPWDPWGIEKKLVGLNIRTVGKSCCTKNSWVWVSPVFALGSGLVLKE